jgi:hypothetical protein
MSKPGQHVVPSAGGWKVIKAGASRASGRYGTQKEAILQGRSLAQSQGTELYIHGEDGRIQSRASYGSDPAARKG